MKRFFAVLLALLLLFTAAACGAKEPVASQPAPEKTEPIQEAAPSAEPAAEEAVPEAVPEVAPEAELETEPETTEEETAPENSSLPDADLIFNTVDMDGNVFQTSNFADSTITILNFWAPWCVPCCSEMPELEKLYQNYREQGVTIWGINVDNSIPEDTEAAIRETGITYPVLEYTDAFEVLQTSRIPVTCFVNKEGKIMGEVVVGAFPYEMWETMLQMRLPKE